MLIVTVYTPVSYTMIVKKLIIAFIDIAIVKYKFYKIDLTPLINCRAKHVFAFYSNVSYHVLAATSIHTTKVTSANKNAVKIT